MAKTYLRILIAGVLMSSLCGEIRAQTNRTSDGTLTGDVADEAENAPISSAFLLIHRPDGRKDIVVKISDGRFRLSLAAGLYDVFVAAPGFAPSCRKIEVSKGHTTAFKPRLSPDTEHLQQSGVH